MTEMQVLAFQQLTTSLAAFDRDHRLIKSGDVTLETDDKYNIVETEKVIHAIDLQLKALCSVAGRTDL